MSFNDRVVVGLDTLDLQIGRIAAWKIESEMNLNTVVSAYGSTRKEKQSGKLHEWFSPEYGIVKTERDMDDHSTVIEMSLIK
jgi:L-rhamnose isomerase